MKKYILVICTISIMMVTTIFIAIKSGNRTSSIPLMPEKEYSKQDIENLSCLCKIWGFLKYYHPDIRHGKYNWDEELLQIMPEIASAQSVKIRNGTLTKWVKRFDTNMKKNKKAFPFKNYIKMYPDIAWIENENELGPELSKLLCKIWNAERDSTNWYAQPFRSQPIFENVTDFINEQKIQKWEVPQPNIQLLALFRLWNAIQYYYPYKYTLQEDCKEDI